MIELNLFGKSQATPRPPRNRVKFYLNFPQDPSGFDTEYLECVGRILPRTADQAENEIEVLLEPEKCSTGNGWGVIDESMTDEDLETWSNIGVRKTPLGWIASCLEGEYEVLK
jgi:hypothetical protein